MKRTLLLGAVATLMAATGAMAQTNPAQQPNSATQQGITQQQQNPSMAPNAVGDKAGMGTAASLDHMMGKDVYGAEGNKIGSVEDIILDPQTGKAQLAVIERGGLLGIGGKSFAIDYTLLGMEGDRLVAKQVTEAQAKAMPEFKYGDNAVSYNRSRNQGSGTVKQ
ncbi:PRC-barrel domain-containing protein [Azospirillum sp. TSO22-1]|uniref:PRC-barrel domain-containing protein n=1 Tax=Azospirillum sp. TSO22-1 TaxID=716789 RepID=UPI000D6584B5|nr:PRC-barrel domain-containing protein [Azospirillum sp. TSO22-1]